MPDFPSTLGRRLRKVRHGAGRVVIRIRRLLRGPQRLGNVTQIDADAIPDIGRSSHAIHPNIVYREMAGDLGMRRPPAIEARFGSRLVG